MGFQNPSISRVVLGAALMTLSCPAQGVGRGIVVKSGFVDVDKARLAYDEAGEGDAVVLIHGGMLAKEMWDGTFEDLAGSYRVVRYDARNHGQSRSEKVVFAHFLDLNALLEKLNVGRAVIVGLSMGSYVATDFALKYPEKVAGLILVGPGLSGYEFHGPEFDAYVEKYTAAYKSGDKEKIIDAFMSGWAFGPKRKPEDLPQAFRDKVRGMVRQSLATENEEAQEARLSPLAIGRLAEIKAPTLAIVGDLDMPDIFEIADLYGKSLTHFEKVIVPGAAHLVCLEKPAEFNAAVGAFLRKIYGH
jgi:3-oxoadipate enol-lactonase